MTRLRVAAVQTDPVFGRVDENVATALALVPADCDLAVLPELFATGYQFRDPAEALALAEPAPDGPVCAALREFAAARDVTLVAGLAERAGDRVFNSAVLLRPDGSWSVYRKTHLFRDEHALFAPGDTGFAATAAAGVAVGLMVCYDWIFPESARTLALAGARLICHPSNLVLPWCPDAMVTRCLENRVFAVTANRVGHENRTGIPLRFIGRSQVVSPRGERLAALGEDETGAAVAEIVLDEALAVERDDLLGARRPEFYSL